MNVEELCSNQYQSVSKNHKDRVKNLNKKIFFILGTARTRSSWFGNFFTYKDSFCYNEESRYLDSWDDLIDRIEERSEDYVGFEDPELLHYIKYLCELFPNATYVLLERDKKESMNSLRNHTGQSEDDPLLNEKFDRWYRDIDNFKTMIPDYQTIHFNDVDDIDEIKRIWNYVLPDVHFDIGRWNLLTGLKVSITLGDKPKMISPYCMAPYYDMDKLRLIA